MNIQQMLDENYDQDTIKKGDIVVYIQTSSPGLNNNNSQYMRYGEVKGMKHGLYQIHPCYAAYDWLTGRYEVSMSGPFDKKVTLLRERKDIRKPGIEDLI